MAKSMVSRDGVNRCTMSQFILLLVEFVCIQELRPSILGKSWKGRLEQFRVGI